MTRLNTIILLVLLAVGAWLLPQPTTPPPDAEAPMHEEKFAVCPVDEGGGRTSEISAISSTLAPVQFSLFTNGRDAGNIASTTGESGTTVIPVVDVAAVGLVGGLVEFPDAGSAAMSIIRSPESITADTCVTDTPAQTFITGASTAGETVFELIMINPFAADAVVRLTVTSEVGTESNDRFASVVVPAASLVALDFSTLTPQREFLSVLIDAVEGRAFAVGRQFDSLDSAVWNAESPRFDWFVPLPEEDREAQDVRIGNATAAEVEYQVDVYGDEGLVEAAVSGVIDPGGQVSVDLSELGDLRVDAVRIVATGPVGVALISRGQDRLAITTVGHQSSSLWSIPGALYAQLEDEEEVEEGEEVVEDPERSRLVILNPGLDDADVVVRVLGANPSEQTFDLAAEGVMRIDVVPGDGYMVEASSPVVILWVVGDSRAFSMGVPDPNG